MTPLPPALQFAGISLGPELGIPIILLLVLAEGFFSGSELALVAADKAAIRAEKERGGRTGQMLASFLEAPERILTTTLIGTNVCTVSSSTVCGIMLAGLFSNASSSTNGMLTVLFLSPVLLVFGELIPKSLFRRYSRQLSRVVIHPLTWLSYPALPLTAAIRMLSLVILRVIGAPDHGAMAVSRDELRLLLKRGEGGEGDAEIEEEELRMIRRIFDFPSVTSKEVMVPLIDVMALEESAPLEDAAQRFVESGFSRLPVFNERVDNIVGVLHAMDVLQAFAFMQRQTVRGKDAMVSRLKRPVTYVAPNQKVEALLETLQHQRHSLAVVVDEWGGAEGVITVEDILEEILGEIEDEHDDSPPDIRRRGEREYLVAARTEVDHLNEELGEAIPAGDYETVGGFLVDALGCIPDQGDSYETEHALLTVVDATERVVEQVQIVLKENPDEDAPEGPDGPGSH